MRSVDIKPELFELQAAAEVDGEVPAVDLQRVAAGEALAAEAASEERDSVLSVVAVADYSVRAAAAAVAMDHLEDLVDTEAVAAAGHPQVTLSSNQLALLDHQAPTQLPLQATANHPHHTDLLLDQALHTVPHLVLQALMEPPLPLQAHTVPLLALLLPLTELLLAVHLPLMELLQVVHLPPTVLLLAAHLPLTELLLHHLLHTEPHLALQLHSAHQGLPALSDHL